jgi:hypothetical protein
MTWTMPTIKPLSHAGVAAALQKAQRYRLLNDSAAAESICLDVLGLEPENVEALVMHVLAITDQFSTGQASDRTRAHAAVARLTDPYQRAYYSGVVWERWAKVLLHRAAPESADMAFESLDKALRFYSEAEGVRTGGDDEVILRWNTCVRMLQRNPHLRPRAPDAWEPSLE